MHEKTLSAVLREFARTLATDFPIQGILDHLVEQVVQVLPITAAGVTLITEGKAPHYIAASNPDALRFEKLQSEIGEGPCLAAHSSGKAVLVADLGRDARFPRFAPHAKAAGLAAVFAFPLTYAGGSLGALDLYRDLPGTLTPEEVDAAQTLADVTVAYLLNAQAREEAKTTSEQFRHSAMHDPLTGLPNRLLLAQRIEHAALRARRSHSRAAILFADLDGFKRVNDTHGHHVGDELLLSVATRLSALVRPGDTLCRFAGDEFVFLCEDLHNEADADMLAQRVHEAFAEPFDLLGRHVSVTASVGMAFTALGEDISHELVVKADTAMYEVKRKGGPSRHIIDLLEADATVRRGGLQVDLAAALAAGELELAYQPIVTCADGSVTGAEALLRWTHARYGRVPAADMVAAAEESSLIIDVGSWVLKQACADHATWPRTHGDSPLDLAVNVSPRQLMSRGYVATVAQVMADTGTDPAALILEITEQVLLEDSERAMTVLADLKTLGIRVALDDFGTGYSSLSYLRRLPIDIVKIDQSFVADLGAAPGGQAILAAISNLAHLLQLVVVAEGVETLAQRDAVAAIGCDAAQGFFYAGPLPSGALAATLLRLPTVPVRLPSARTVSLITG